MTEALVVEVRPRLGVVALGTGAARLSVEDDLHVPEPAGVGVLVALLTAARRTAELPGGAVDRIDVALRAFLLLVLASQRQRRARVVREIEESLATKEEAREVERGVVAAAGEDIDVHEAIQQMEKEMLAAAQALEFERAAVLRDEIEELKNQTGLT